MLKVMAATRRRCILEKCRENSANKNSYGINNCGAANV
jgi:hypothetical protein